MFYQLPNGKVIEISTEQYFEMSDEELEYLIAYNYGDILENPWHGSILNNHGFNVNNKATMDETDDSDILPDLTSITDIEKIIDLDAESEDITD